DFYFGIFPLTFVQPGKERLLNALRARARRLLRTGSNLWQHRRDQFLDIAALAEEDLEGLLEKNRMLVPLHKHGMEYPVEIGARTNAGNRERFQRIKHRSWPDRNTCRAQGAREVDDVFGKAAFGRGHDATPPPATPTSPDQ